MQRVLVLDTNKNPLMPTHPAKALVPKGKKAGTYVGAVAIRSSGSFRAGSVDGINWKYCQLIQRTDGYSYLERSLP